MLGWPRLTRAHLGRAVHSWTHADGLAGAVSGHGHGPPSPPPRVEEARNERNERALSVRVRGLRRKERKGRGQGSCNGRPPRYCEGSSDWVPETDQKKKMRGARERNNQTGSRVSRPASVSTPPPPSQFPPCRELSRLPISEPSSAHPPTPIHRQDHQSLGRGGG